MSKEQLLAVAMVLLTVQQVAKMLNVSPRSVWRMHDSGRMPRAVKLGASCRWRLKEDIEPWITMGLPDRATFEARKEACHA